MDPASKKELIDGMNKNMADGFVPHNKALGFVVKDIGEGFAITGLPYDDKLVGNPDTGVLHGGAVTSLLDATCGMAVFISMRSPRRIATLDLRIDYMGPAEPGRDVLARATCYKVTRHVAFVRAVAYHDSPDDPIAAAAGSFMIFQDETSPMAQTLKDKYDRAEE